MILLIDADDTLWENNIYFERVIERFIARLNHAHLTPGEVRAVINEIELARAATHGYGTASFTKNLRVAFERLSSAVPDDWEWLDELGRSITEHPVELIDGVAETLAYLRPRHHLVLFTKGDRDEQLSKTSRSGLDAHFHATRVVHEKNAAAYSQIAAELAVPPRDIWMIGNSPRSDINPSLEAGLNAVWIPHAATWILEHEEVRDVLGRLLTLSRFGELRDHF